jgi:SP family galactose:H+ symporter-like MFS transporter
VKTSPAAIFMGIHLSIFKQLTGLSVITVYGKETLLKIVPEISDVLPILISFIPCISAIFVSPLLNRFGRKTLIRNGALVIMLCQLMIIIAFFVKDQAGSFSNLAISSSMIVFMISFGFSFGPVVFTYIPEIMEPKYIPSSTFANLTGMAFCILVFPLIEGILPNDNPSPMFLFFFIWCFISLIINSKYMIETKDKSRAEVFLQYLKLKPCS